MKYNNQIPNYEHQKNEQFWLNNYSKPNWISSQDKINYYYKLWIQSFEMRTNQLIT